MRQSWVAGLRVIVLKYLSCVEDTLFRTPSMQSSVRFLIRDSKVSGPGVNRKGAGHQLMP